MTPDTNKNTSKTILYLLAITILSLGAVAVLSSSGTSAGIVFAALIALTIPFFAIGIIFLTAKLISDTISNKLSSNEPANTTASPDSSPSDVVVMQDLEAPGQYDNGMLSLVVGVIGLTFVPITLLLFLLYLHATESNFLVILSSGPRVVISVFLFSIAVTSSMLLIKLANISSLVAKIILYVYLFTIWTVLIVSFLIWR